MVDRKLRADTQRTRDLLFDAMGRLLEERGLDFSLPDLARESGVATATVYRHFDDFGDLRKKFYGQLIEGLFGDFAAVDAGDSGRARLSAMCRAWVHRMLPWAQAASYIRSAEGFLERYRAGDPSVTRLHGLLSEVIDALVAEGSVPEQDREYAVLMWVTLFDERVLLDLSVAKGWGEARIVAELESSLLALLTRPT